MTRCPQCFSLWCGAVACHYTKVKHLDAEARKTEIRYAEAMSQRDKTPRWEREAATGARDVNTRGYTE